MADESPLTIITSYDTLGGPSVLEASGTLGRRGAEELLEAVERSEPVVILDLTEVTSTDASGIRTLVVGTQQLRRRDVRVLLCGLQPQVESLLNITGAQEFLEVYPDRPAALAQLMRES